MGRDKMVRGSVDCASRRMRRHHPGLSCVTHATFKSTMHFRRQDYKENVLKMVNSAHVSQARELNTFAVEKSAYRFCREFLALKGIVDRRKVENFGSSLPQVLSLEVRSEDCIFCSRSALYFFLQFSALIGEGQKIFCALKTLISCQFSFKCAARLHWPL